MLPLQGVGQFKCTDKISLIPATSAYSPDQCLFHYYRDSTTVADRGDNRFVKPVAE
jgi:hypothetical protein